MPPFAWLKAEESRFYLIAQSIVFLLTVWMMYSFSQQSVERSTPTVLATSASPIPAIQILLSILTIPRPENAAYLYQSLESLRNELTDIGEAADGVSVLVQNLRPRNHTVFARAKRDFAVDDDVRFVFREQEPTFADVVAPNGEKTWKGKWRPMTLSTYQLNLDFLLYFNHTAHHCASNMIEYVLLMEDDFVWCPLGLQHLLRATRIANRRFVHWAAMRISYGMNGVLLRCADLPALYQFAKENRLIGPLDSVLGEYWSKSTALGEIALAKRDYLVYRYNLLHHIGDKSARLNGDYEIPGRCFPPCYGLIQYLGLMSQENYHNACLWDDFTPCDACRNRRGQCKAETFPELVARTRLKIKNQEC